MPPFAQLRLWLREGPRAERWVAVFATAVVLTLLAFSLVPVARSSSGTGFPSSGPAVVVPTSPATSGHHPQGDGTTTPGASRPTSRPTAGGPHTPNTPGSTSGPTPSTRPGRPTPQPTKGGGTAKNDCSGATLTSAQGVTPTEIHIDVAIPQLAGAVGNAAFNIPADQAGIFDALTNYVNHHGGLACGRKLVTKIYTVNPIDSNNQQSTCLQIVQDKPIAVINGGAYVTPVSQQCFITNHLPLDTATSPGKRPARRAHASIGYAQPPLLGSSARGPLPITTIRRGGKLHGRERKKIKKIKK